MKLSETMGLTPSFMMVGITNFLEDFRWIARMAMTDGKNCLVMHQYCEEADMNHTFMRIHSAILGMQELHDSSSEDQVRLCLEILAETFWESE